MTARVDGVVRSVSLLPARTQVYKQPCFAKVCSLARAVEVLPPCPKVDTERERA